MALTHYRLRVQATAGLPATDLAWLSARLAGMSAGDWLDASSTTNVADLADTGPDGDVGYLEAVANNVVPQWSGKMTALTSSVVLTGCGNGFASEVPAGTHSKTITFNLVSGEFAQSQWNPFDVNIGHVYDANPSRALNGYVYCRAYNDSTLYRADTATMTWASYADLTALGLSVVHSMDVFPSLGAQGSIIFCGNNGKLSRLDIATGDKTTLSAGLSGVTSGYTVCSYHPGIDAVLAGGGDTTPFPLHKLDNTGTLTQLTTTAPTGVANISPPSATAATVFAPDPLGRAYAWLFDFNNTLGLFRLDLTAGTWGAETALPGDAPGQSSCVAAIPDTGAFVVFDGRGQSVGSSLSRVWVHKVT